MWPLSLGINPPSAFFAEAWSEVQEPAIPGLTFANSVGKKPRDHTLVWEGKCDGSHLKG